MRLTKWTDYTLRVLLYCASTQTREQPPTISEIAETHQISRSHLMKIVMTLSSLGWVMSMRGRGGGLRLAVAPDQIKVGDVVRRTETDFHMVECFNPTSNTCPLTARCRLKSVLKTASDKFLDELDQVTIADLLPSAGEAKASPIKILKK